jgi:hypothetical protein
MVEIGVRHKRKKKTVRRIRGLIKYQSINTKLVRIS